MNLRWLCVITISAVVFPASLMAASVLEGGAGTSADATRTDVILLVVYVLLALVFSFLCSIAEATLLSITPSYIAGQKDQHPKRAALLKQLKQDNVDRSLAAILTLNTIAHTVGAIGSGSKATAVFGSAWFGLFSAVMTLLILFLSEIVPKTLGALYWRQLAAPTAHFVRALIIAQYPLILVSERLTRLMSRGQKVHAFSRDEFVALAGIGERAGAIDAHESRILRNVFRLGALSARDIMTPRTVIVALSEDATVEEALKQPGHGAFSRLPLYARDADEITGFVLKQDLLHMTSDSMQGRELRSIKRELPSVFESMPLPRLLEFFLDQRCHIALVVDEYGATVGLVTLEDLVETLLGMEILDERDEVTNMRALARSQWRKRATQMGLNVTEE